MPSPYQGANLFYELEAFAMNARAKCDVCNQDRTFLGKELGNVLDP